MNRREFIGSALGTSAGMALSGCAGSKLLSSKNNNEGNKDSKTSSSKIRTPNLLFIWTDEQRFDTLTCYGNSFINTPNLDKLAEKSFVFENAYVTQPVCSPSRSTVMTGLYPHSTGVTANNVPLSEQTKTIAEMVSDEYVCGYYGKWHLGNEVIRQHGFDNWTSIEDSYRKYYTQKQYLSQWSDYRQYLIDNGFEPETDYWVPEGGRYEERGKFFDRRRAAKMPAEFTKATFLGKKASEFIKNNREIPFLLHVNFLEPHMPFTGPYNDRYNPAEVPVGNRFLERPSRQVSLINRMISDYYTEQKDYGVDSFDLSNEKGWRRLYANYCGLVKLVDESVGKILSALEASGQSENTIIVFTSDHGDMMGDHAQLAKCVMYEEAVKVPLLIHVPWLKKSVKKVPGRISQVDLVPTLLDLMGQDIDEKIQGQSRRTVLEGTKDLKDNYVYIEWNGDDGRTKKYFKVKRSISAQRVLANPTWRTIISPDGWKLNLSPVDQCELYDLNNDPGETQNLYCDKSQQVRIKELTQQIYRWQRETHDLQRL